MCDLSRHEIINAVLSNRRAIIVSSKSTPIFYRTSCKEDKLFLYFDYSNNCTLSIYIEFRGLGYLKCIYLNGFIKNGVFTVVDMSGKKYFR